MTRLLAVLVVAIAASLVSSADPPTEPKSSDEAPLRLKKKNKDPLPVPGKDELDKKPISEDQPPIDEGKDREAKDQPGGDAQERAVRDEDFQDVLERLGKNMRLAEDRLDNKELGDGLRAIQDDIVKDLDSLIKGQQQPPQDQSGGGSSASNDSKPQQQSSRQGGSRDQQKQQAARGMRNRPQPRNQGGDQVARNDQRPGTPKGSGSQSNPNVQPGSGDSKMGPNTPAEVLKDAKDLWGNLPATKRAEMDAYARERFMTKYEALIRRYYETLSETSRRGTEGK
jgi:hypothetical protein